MVTSAPVRPRARVMIAMPPTLSRRPHAIPAVAGGAPMRSAIVSRHPGEHRTAGRLSMTTEYDGYLNVLFVADYAKARDFYENVMGLECANGTEGVDAYFNIGPAGLMII